jgi:uncharacterized protein (TIGR01777 family)
MFPVLCLSGAQVAMGAFDNFYHHEFTERLPWTPTAAHEQHIHAIRGSVYVGVFACFAGVVPQGALAYGLAAALVGEVGVTCWDFVVEDATRLRYPATERVTHTLMAINYGAILGHWLPLVLGTWALQPTGLALQSYGAFTPLYAACAAGLGAWAVRDQLASRRLQRFAQQPLPQLPELAGAPLRVLVSGGSGFIGLRLVRCLLHQGHAVTVVTRDRKGTMRRLELMSPRARGGGDLTLVTAPSACAAPCFDVVVNLAGASLAEQRWTPAREAELFRSRLEMTSDLIEMMRRQPSPPRVFVSGSAIGYYGLSAEAVAGEETPPREVTSLSHRLCGQWEERALEAETELGTRTVLLRSGLVLGRDGGALAQMLPAFELGLGGPLGGGSQVMPWIHIDDHLRAISWCVGNESVRGPVNLTSPFAVDNEGFSRALGHSLGRPALLRVPARLLRALLGRSLADELLLEGSVVRPKRLLDEGFIFNHPTLLGALRHIVVAPRLPEDGAAAEGRVAGYRTAMGAEFQSLPSAIRNFHDGAPHQQVCAGAFRVSRGDGLALDLLAFLGGLPVAANAAEVVSATTDVGDGRVRLERTFDGRPFVSTLDFSSEHGLMIETFEAVFGLVTVRFGFQVTGTPCGRGFRQKSVQMWLGGLPVPSALALHVDVAAVALDEAAWNTQVELTAPLGLGKLVRYEGDVRMQYSGGAV